MNSEHPASAPALPHSFSGSASAAERASGERGAASELGELEAQRFAGPGLVAEVAVMAPAPGPYHYAVPRGLADRVRSGTRVMVSLGGQRNLEGVVLRLIPAAEALRDRRSGGAAPVLPVLKDLGDVVKGAPVPADLLALIRFIADYYLAPIGEALRLLLPSSEQAEVAERVVLTAEGQTLAGQLDAALLPAAAAERSDKELAVLRALLGLHTTRKGAAVAMEQVVKVLAAAAPTGAASAERSGRARTEVAAVLRRLAEAGLVALQSEVRAGAAPRKTTLVAPSAQEPTPEQQQRLRRSQAAAALLALLRQQGPTPLAALRERWPSAALITRKLCAEGLCTVTEVAAAPEPSPQREELPSSAAATPPVLTAEQQTALDVLLQGLQKSLTAAAGSNAGYSGYLLHGVTGSGKTELYLQLIDAALKAGRTALVLVPEIALTPQLSARFMARFGRDVAVLHSALTPSQRAEAWRRLLHGEVRIALGPRSALFAPLSRLGVVIVDEEHDSSFKQQDGVRYHGRDTALVRAQQAGAVAVLGSATPSLESMELVRRGKLVRLSLHKRATGVPMPGVTVIDLKKHVFAEDRMLLSAPLQTALTETLLAGEQAILFLNRRGYATFLLCQQCGHRLECRHCAVTLTWHKELGELCCHYCGQREPEPVVCPLCQQKSIRRLGLGTEKLQEQVAACFPAARVARLDRDTATASGLNKILAAMHRREVDLLIGTQMLAKGHDFPGVTLVGVVLADTGMGLPDFRASERTFQLLAQVAGRAGRQGRAGRVLIQTYNPEHPAVAAAAQHDYLAFAQAELYAREQLGYPPYCRLGLLRIDGVDPYAVRAAAEEVAAAVRVIMDRERNRLEAGAAGGAALSLLGPAEAPLSRLKGRTRWQLLVRAPTSRALRAVLRTALQIKLPRALRLTADVDPVSTL